MNECDLNYTYLMHAKLLEISCFDRLLSIK